MYTFHNISTYHVLSKKLNFKLEAIGTSYNAYIEIFLLASDPNVMLGNMYYIQLQLEYYYNSRRKRFQSYSLRKCTSDYEYNDKIGGNLQRSDCNSIRNNVSTSGNFKL